jgi:hypothetical protein
MQVRDEAQTKMSAEIGLIPSWAWALAAFGFISAQIFFDVIMARQLDGPSVAVRAALGTIAGIVLGCYLLFIGYINRDARRREMSPLLWTLVAILIPNCLGFLLYFILRKPLPSAVLPSAGEIQTDFQLCPRCSYKLTRSCPQCERTIGIDDLYCRHCGASLQDQAVRPRAPQREVLS